MFKALIRALCLTFALSPGLAAAQVPPFTLPAGTVIGRSQIGPGPAQAIPFSQLIALMLQSTLTIPTLNTNSIVFKGSVSGQATVQAQAAAGTPTLLLPTGSGTIPSSATLPLVFDPVTGIASCPTCAISVGIYNAATRAAAVSVNLSSYNLVRTGGYALVGDGGGATFKNVGSTPFLEQSVQTCGGIVGGASYTNGTYRGVPLTGGTGHGVVATVVVAGNVVSSVTISNWGGNAYTTNDSLSAAAASVGGTGGGFTCTATVNAALGSFSDSVGTHFQIIPDSSASNSTAQFGCKMDYQGTDGSATDNTSCLFNAFQYSGNIPTPALTVDDGGSAGALLVSPTGSGLVCPTGKPFQVPSSVRWWGTNAWGTTWKLCNSFASSSQEVIDLCDTQSHLACFGTQVANMTFFANNSPASAANVAFIFSNSIQQINALYRIAIYSGLRSCINFSTGFGGAAWVGIEAVECTPWPTSTNPVINFTSYGSTLIKVKDTFVEGSTSVTIPAGIQFAGNGFLDVDGFHTEGLPIGIFLNNTGSTSTGAARLHNLTGGNGCTDLVLKQGGSVANDVIIGMAFPNGCTHTVNNGGSFTTTPVIADTTY